MTAMDTPLMNGAPVAQKEKIESAVPVRVSFAGSKGSVRLVFRLAGILLIMAAPAMWVLPGSTFSVEAAVMKLGSSIFFLLCGLALLMRNHVSALPEVHFDPIRRELRIMQRNDRGRPHTVLRRGYDTLGGVYFATDWVEFWNKDGSTLLSLPVKDADTRQALRVQLGSLCA